MCVVFIQFIYTVYMVKVYYYSQLAATHAHPMWFRVIAYMYEEAGAQATV